MSPVCSKCDGDIAADNRAFPGYCSPDCRREADEQRDATAAAEAQKQAARRRVAARNKPIHYVT